MKEEIDAAKVRQKVEKRKLEIENYKEKRG